MTPTFTVSLLLLQEGHYNYELGENISSRCECMTGPWMGDVQAQHIQQERSSIIWAAAEHSQTPLMTRARSKGRLCSIKCHVPYNISVQAHARVALLA
jgi:hypothetical protein